MRKIIYFAILIASVFLFSFIKNAYGDELDDINKQLQDLKTAYNQSKAATAPLESQLNSIKQRVSFIENDLIRKKREINNGYKNLEDKKIIFDKTVTRNYIESYNNNWLSYLVGSEASGIIQNLAYQKAKADQDKVIITNIALSITDLEEKRKNLESEEAKLAAIKISLDKVVTEAKTYQTTLSNKIAALSARQQQILAQRLSDLGIPLYAVSLKGCSSDIGKSPNFSGGYGFFTYGVNNRVGLNQFGAKGRAEANPPQNADTILHAYYNFDGYKTVDPNSITIRVNDSNGYDSGNIIWSGVLDDYIKRIYEIPEDWPAESLKAQVIAARSYVLAQTNNGNKSICANQNCQVFQTNEKGGAWSHAVNDTPGQVMIQGDTIITAYFSSTHGGYTHNAGGDISNRPWLKNAQDTTSSVASFDDLKNNSYDGPSHANSPWFYCDWGYRPEQNKTAWLKSEEVADIINVLLLIQRDSGTKEHLYQTDKPNLAGTDTWDAGRVKQELSNQGGLPFNNISSISVGVDFGSGQTNSVNISGDVGNVSFSGSDFKTYFNLRAPANIQIVGPLYNIERN